jgi:hypothetical protein
VKYMMLFCNAMTDEAAWTAMEPDARSEVDNRVYAWFAEHGPRMSENARLDDPAKAKTVKPDASGDMLVTDGPYVESGEVVGGYAIVEAESVDEVVAMAKGWPVGAVEIRQLV